MSALPPDLQIFHDAMDAADREAESIAAKVTDEEFFWQPDEGRRWSIALCLDHLTIANTIYGGAMRGAVDRARAAGWTRRGPAKPGFFGRKFAESLEPPVRRRTKNPAKITPRPLGDRAEILRQYHAAHDDIRTLIVDAAGLDLNRASFMNPFIGVVRVKVSSALQIIAAHDRRHLWQAEQVRRLKQEG